MNHVSSSCAGQNVVGYPCQKHGPNDKTGHYHNERFHCENWTETRNKYFLPRSNAFSLDTEFLPEADHCDYPDNFNQQQPSELALDYDDSNI